MSSTNQEISNLVEKMLKSNQHFLENHLRKVTLKQLQKSYFQLQQVIQMSKSLNNQRLLHRLLDSSLTTQEYLKNSRNFSTLNLAGQINTLQFNLKMAKEHIDDAKNDPMEEVASQSLCIIL